MTCQVDSCVGWAFLRFFYGGIPICIVEKCDYDYQNHVDAPYSAELCKFILDGLLSLVFSIHVDFKALQIEHHQVERCLVDLHEQEEHYFYAE